MEQQFANLLEVGREALARGDWEEARVAFEAALNQEETRETLEGLSWAAAWLEDGATAIEARSPREITGHESDQMIEFLISRGERTYRLYQERGDRPGAARMAIWLTGDYFYFRGEPGVADGWLQRARRLLEGLDPTPEHAWLIYMDGYIALFLQHDTAAAGDGETARRQFEDAVDLFKHSSALFETGRTRLELARVLAALGGFEAAEKEGRAALSSFQKVGAVREAERAEAFLRDLKVTTRAPTSKAPNLTRLTRREQEVLRLIAPLDNLVRRSDPLKRFYPTGSRKV
ncbi:hypothetical protein L0337_02345 [candidate division KSB1 bacterium]|nr:hypothetical protein [candidate division KSB1 bacterium]